MSGPLAWWEWAIGVTSIGVLAAAFLYLWIGLLCTSGVRVALAFLGLLAAILLVSFGSSYFVVRLWGTP